MGECSSRDTDRARQKIATLIFMDLETTGLPSDVGRKNVHITEMCMVAIDRRSFEDDKSLRVLNKLSLCMRPRSVVSHIAMAMTGLYNDNLDNQEEFDDSVPKLLEYFFRRLQSPICLLAHNGNRFDFPVLQAELKRLNYALNSNILCADTLVAFRSICLSHKLDNDSNFEEKSDGRNEHIPPTEVSNCVQISGDNHTNVSRAPKELVTRSQDTVQPEQMQSPSCVPISEDDIDDLLSQDLESFSCMDINLKTEESNYLKSKGNDISPSESNLKVNDIVHKTNGDQCIPSSAPIFDECTPPKSKIVPNFSENIKNIHRKRKMSSAARENGHTEHITPVKRTLFPKNDPLPLSKITKFSLENLYNHFFHEDPPVSHFAESDCISLSKVCQKISKEFLQWIDENSVTFSSVDAFW